MLACILCAGTIHADEDVLSDEFALLEEALSRDEIETASKRRQSIYFSPSAITVFTRSQIRDSGATTLPDLLRRVPGFDVYEVKPSFPLVGARALTDESSNLVLVIIDGREALIEVSGFPLWASLVIDIEDIERLEVIRGPGSALYGANAFAAVVSITTIDEAPARSGGLLLRGGELGQRHLAARFTDVWPLGEDTLDAGAAIGTEGIRSPSDPGLLIKEVALRSHGYLRYRRADRLEASLHAGYVRGGGPLYVQLGDVDASGFSHHLMGKLSFVPSARTRLRLQLYHNRYRADFDYTTSVMAYGTWVANIPDFYVDTHSLDTQVQLDWSVIEPLLLIAGIDLRYTTQQSDRIVPSGIEELRVAGFVQAQWNPVEDLQLTGGVRLDVNSVTDPALSPRLVAVWRPWPRQSFRLGYGLAFRKPSFIEAQVHLEVTEYNEAFPEVVDLLAEQLGNPALRNEKVHSFEAGWRGGFFDEHLVVTLDLFHNIYLDSIGYVVDIPPRMGLPDIANATLQFQNESGRVEATGGELEARLHAAAHWTLWANLGLRRVVDATSGERLRGEPVLRVNAGGGHHPDEGVVFDLALHHVSAYRFSRLDPINPMEARVVEELGEHTLLIGKLGYRWQRTERSLEAGLSIRAPLGGPFREFAGSRLPPALMTSNRADFAGEQLVRIVTLHLQVTF